MWLSSAKIGMRTSFAPSLAVAKPGSGMVTGCWLLSAGNKRKNLRSQREPASILNANNGEGDRMTDSERLIELLTQSQYTTVLTGAGVSTESGIPDFRSPETGLWSKMDPMELFSRQVLELTPDVFWQRAEPLFREFASAQPNACHRALARLEQAGIIGGVVTQNIDGLHQMAGSKRVLEVHGHLRSGSCRKCCHKKSMEVLLEQVRKGESPPRCNCGGVFRPDVVLF